MAGVRRVPDLAWEQTIPHRVMNRYGPHTDGKYPTGERLVRASHLISDRIGRRLVGHGDILLSACAVGTFRRCLSQQHMVAPYAVALIDRLMHHAEISIDCRPPELFRPLTDRDRARIRRRRSSR